MSSFQPLPPIPPTPPPGGPFLRGTSPGAEYAVPRIGTSTEYLDLAQPLSASVEGPDEPEVRPQRRLGATMTYAGDMFLQMDADSKEPTSIPRSNTFHGQPGRRRRDEARDLTPAALAHLHKLHEAFLRYRDPWATPEDTSEAALDACWGEVDSWHVHCIVPTGSSEQSFNARRLKVCPSGYERANVALRTNGISIINTKGWKESDSILGQDNCSFSHLSQGWEVLCVMDGHGTDGHWPATRAVRTMPFFLKGKSCSQMLEHWEVEAALTHAFGKVEMDLERQARVHNLKLQATGCTALCAVWNSRCSKLWVATAGDSRAILLVPGVGVVAQTTDHKPCVQSERERVEAAGGEIVCTTFTDGFVECRINVKGTEFPGISMTRSLGDLSVKECGVIAEPEVVEWSLEGRGNALILAASDGVWEFLPTEEVASIVLSELEKGVTYQRALETLLEAARRKWHQHEDSYCDDITIAMASVAGLKYMNVSGRANLLCRGNICKGDGCQIL